MQAIPLSGIDCNETEKKKIIFHVNTHIDIVLRLYVSEFECMSPHYIDVHMYYCGDDEAHK